MNKGVSRELSSKWNKNLEGKAVIYLITNPNKTIQSFCKSRKISYQYFLRKFNADSIYKKVETALSKKQQERLKQVENKLIEQGKQEAVNIINLHSELFKILQRPLNYLDKKQACFKSDSDAIKAIRDITVLLLELRNYGLIPETQGHEADKFASIREHIKELITFKKENAENAEKYEYIVGSHNKETKEYIDKMIDKQIT